MILEFIEHIRSPCWGGNKITALYEAQHKGNTYQVYCIVCGFESTNLSMTVSEVILPKHTNEDTLTEESVTERVQEYIDS